MSLLQSSNSIIHGNLQICSIFLWIIPKTTLELKPHLLHEHNV
jgi:hypothetical protein